MERVTLSPGPPELALVRDQQGTAFTIHSAEDELLASFPVKMSLLRAVADGFAYQVANEYGSLRFALDGDQIEARFEARTKSSVRARLDRQIFSEAAAKFHADSV